MLHVAFLMLVKRGGMPVCSFIRSFIQSFGRYPVTSGGPGSVLTSGNRNQEQASALTEHSCRLEKQTLGRSSGN